MELNTAGLTKAVVNIDIHTLASLVFPVRTNISNGLSFFFFAWAINRREKAKICYLARYFVDPCCVSGRFRKPSPFTRNGFKMGGARRRQKENSKWSLSRQRVLIYIFFFKVNETLNFSLATNTW